MKAKTKKKLSSDLRDLVGLTTLMWRLTVELCSTVPSLVYCISVQDTMELLFTSSPVMVTLEVAVTRWLPSVIFTSSSSSCSLTPARPDQTCTGRGKTLSDRQETVLFSHSPT